MSKIELKNFMFNEYGVSGFEKVAEKSGEKIGKFFLTIFRGMVILIFSFGFGMIAGSGKFVKGFQKGMKNTVVP